MAINPIKVWNGTAWEYTGPVVAAPPVKYQATAPTSPATGDVWVESDYDVASVDPSKLLTGGVYTNESTRSAAIPTPTTGMVTYVGDTGTDPSTIPQLETYTGSAWQTPYGSTLLANVPFTTASTITVDNVFTSTYDNYRIMFNISAASAAGNVSLNWVGRTSGSNVTTPYVHQICTADAANLAGGRFGTSQFAQTSGAYASFTQGTMDLLSPKLATKTVWIAPSLYITQAGLPYALTYTGYFDGNNSFDGIQFSVTSGTISGTFRIYGLRNS
jgi:hypothetical protein